MIATTLLGSALKQKGHKYSPKKVEKIAFMLEALEQKEWLMLMEDARAVADVLGLKKRVQKAVEERLKA